MNVGKGRVSANCSVLCGQKYTKLMDDYHAVFQLGSTFVLVELPPYLHTTKCTLPTILVLVFDIVLVPSSEPSYGPDRLELIIFVIINKKICNLPCRL